MPNDAIVQDVRRRLPDDAHVQMLDDALSALTGNNRQRAQHFAVTTRELFAHVLSSNVNDDDVRRCTWYKQDPNARGPTRRQRALYMSRGGLSDDFIKDTLNLDPDEFHKELRQAFDDLSDKTHVRPNSAPTTQDEIEEFANSALGAFAEIFDVLDDVRCQIEGAITPRLQDEAASTFVQETISELDIIAGRYTTESVVFDEPNILDIGPEYITYRIAGTVEVELHYGGKSDPTQIDESFPFACTIVADVNTPLKFLSDMTKMEVDTSSWHGDQEDDKSGNTSVAPPATTH